MWFMNGDRTELINPNYVERFAVVEKPGIFLLIASYGETRCRTLATYTSKEEAYNALAELFRAISENKPLYFMDGNTEYMDYQRPKAGHHGKKSIRHGGS